MNVKRTFFITEEQAKILREEKKDNYIGHRMPCYELEDGTILYPRFGCNDFAAEVTYFKNW
jgi:hypothetical protein